MKKQYLNADERKDWLETCMMSGCMERIIKSNVEMGKAQQYMRTCKTWGLKAVNEFAKYYPSQYQTMIRDSEYYKLMLVPTVTPDQYFADKIKEIHDHPLTQLYDSLDVVVSMICQGCTRDSTTCKLKEVFEKYKIPEVDSENNDCHWRY
jgi:hypothetical protein